VERLQAQTMMDIEDAAKHHAPPVEQQMDEEPPPSGPEYEPIDDDVPF
jgi:hypothetical protein